MKTEFEVYNRGRQDSRLGWLPVTTGYHNFGLRVVTSYHWLPELGLRFVTGYHWLPEFRFQVGYRLQLVTIISVSE